MASLADAPKRRLGALEVPAMGLGCMVRRLVGRLLSCGMCACTCCARGPGAAGWPSSTWPVEAAAAQEGACSATCASPAACPVPVRALQGTTAFYGPADEAEGIATIRRAIELGCTLLDTSDVCESGLGGLQPDIRTRACSNPNAALLVAGVGRLQGRGLRGLLQVL